MSAALELRVPPWQLPKQQYTSTKSVAAIIASWRASASPPPKPKAAFIKTLCLSLRTSGHTHHPQVKFSASARAEAVPSGICMMKDEVGQQQEVNEPPNSAPPENNSPRQGGFRDSNECTVNGQGSDGNGIFGPPPWRRGRGEDEGNPPPPSREVLGPVMMDEDAKGNIIMLGIPWKGFATGFATGCLSALAVKSRDPLSVSELASKEDKDKGSSRFTIVVANKVFGWVGDIAPVTKLTPPVGLNPSLSSGYSGHQGTLAGAVGFGCGLICYHIISVLMTGGRDKK